MRGKRSTSATRLRQAIYNARQDREPRDWDKSVIHALCQRLPAGKTAATTSCEACGSIFYPCFCSSASTPLDGTSDSWLRAPKVLECTERGRLHRPSRGGVRAEGMGGLLRVFEDSVEGVDVQRLQIVGPLDDTALNAVSPVTGFHGGVSGQQAAKKSKEQFRDLARRSTQVLRRRGDQYLVAPDGRPETQQELRLGYEQFSNAAKLMNGSFQVVRRQSTPLKEIRVEYTAQPSEGDVRLRKQFGDWYVAAVAEGGQAEAAGVCAGHRLREALHPKRPGPENKGKLVRGATPNIFLEEDNTQHRKSTGQLSTFADAASAASDWPCTLSFEALAEDWRATDYVKDVVVQLTMDGIDGEELQQDPQKLMQVLTHIQDAAAVAATAVIPEYQMSPDQVSVRLTDSKTILKARFAPDGFAHAQQLHKVMGHTTDFEQAVAKIIADSSDVRDLAGTAVTVSDVHVMSVGDHLTVPMSPCLLERLLHQGRAVTLRFSHRSTELVSREDVVVRHKLDWEQAVDELVSGDPMEQRHKDVELFMQWGISSSVSPARLEFLFRSLSDKLSRRLHSFRKERNEFIQTAINKISSHLLRVRSELERWSQQRPLRLRGRDRGPPKTSEDDIWFMLSTSAPWSLNKLKSKWRPIDKPERLKGVEAIIRKTFTAIQLEDDGKSTTLEEKNTIWQRVHALSTLVTTLQPPDEFPLLNNTEQGQLLKFGNACSQDMLLLIRTMPISYLEDLVTECRYEMEDAIHDERREQQLRRRAESFSDGEDSDGQSEEAEQHDISASLSVSKRQLVLGSLPGVAESGSVPDKATGYRRPSGIRALIGCNTICLRSKAAGFSRIPDSVMLHTLMLQIQKNMGGVERGAETGKSKPLQHADGRITPKDFVNMMICEGMHHMSSRELEAKFQAMDLDDSGYVSIGEVNCTFHRLGDLFMRFRNFSALYGVGAGGSSASGSASDQCGDYRNVSSVLIDEFKKRMLLGDDLGGSSQAMMLKDWKVTASSQHEDCPADSYRLSCRDSAWIPEMPQSLAEAPLHSGNHWLEWRFARPKLVNAVVTTGHPKFADWRVVDYWLEYQYFDKEDLKAATDMSASLNHSFNRSFNTSLSTTCDAPWQRYVYKDGEKEQQIFLGGGEKVESQTLVLEPPIENARAVRIYPRKWSAHQRAPALRATLLGYAQ
eukprot:TRINITY_DN7378_c0_g1_i1.p1 TRINITY_DN7378_c0_g1~~TRINITY_DN7378_c0_g1_i1.p1  ORF type:complete len:1174 (-),score=218.75 TRINITY_DN7378_c0_g1_i1:273-3794(-)